MEPEAAQPAPGRKPPAVRNPAPPPAPVPAVVPAVVPPVAAVPTRTAHQGNGQLFSEICSHLASNPVYNSIQTHALLHLTKKPTHKNGIFAGSSLPSQLPTSSSQSPSPYLSVTHQTLCPFNPSFVTDTPISSPLSNFAVVKVDPKSSLEDPPLQRVKKKPRKYKPADKKVHTVPATLPEEYRIHRNIIGDPLKSMPKLSPHPPNFVPTGHYTQEWMEAMDQAHEGDFLLPKEHKLLHHLMMEQNEAFAWDETEKGHFKEVYFPPIKIPVIKHTPWQLKNMPILPSIYVQVIEAVRKKIASGVYEPSNSSYQSCWFTVVKKDGTLRLVHDLQPLNAVTICDAGVPPFTETLAESCGSRACYRILDLLVGYDHCRLHADSCDLTTFQSPLGTFCITTVPMGWGNSVPIFQADVTYILKDEIPEHTIPFLDDASALAPRSRYERPNSTFEVISENPGIRRFVWEHFVILNRLAQRMKYVGGTWSGTKSKLCYPEVLIVGHLCCYEGRKPNHHYVAKIRTWGVCEELSDVRAFLGTAGLLCIFIKNYAKKAWPLTKLTCTNEPFRWEEDQIQVQEQLRQDILNSPALHGIDYFSFAAVILAVDTSIIAIGYVLLQEDPVKPKIRYPNRFGLIVLNACESNYSQPKLELYGLFRSLRAVKLFIVRVQNLVVEVDAKYIKGMINNPDIQPNTTINRWIAGILLFRFKLVHVPGITHGPDGLSRRRRQPEDEITADDLDDHESDDWIDCPYGLLHLINPQACIAEHDNASYHMLSSVFFSSTLPLQPIFSSSPCFISSSPPSYSPSLSSHPSSQSFSSFTSSSQHFNSSSQPFISPSQRLLYHSSPSHAQNPYTPSSSIPISPLYLPSQSSLTFIQYRNLAIKSFDSSHPLFVHKISQVSPVFSLDFSASPSSDDFSIPRSKHALKQDLKLNQVVQILRDLDVDESLLEKEAKALTRFALKFALRGTDTLLRKGANGPRVVVPPERRPAILTEAHDLVSHKGFIPTYFHIQLRFWWPSMAEDTTWYVRTCHTCQQRQVHHNLRPPIIQRPAPIFVKCYIDVMHMSVKSGGFSYIVQARCLFTSYVEARPLRTETRQTLGNFIFEEIICRWGTIVEIVTDNSTSIVATLEHIAKRYHINHIRISPYNSQANGIVEVKHFSFCDSLFKVCDTDGAEPGSWSCYFFHTL
jgi:hypothetical protein